MGSAFLRRFITSDYSSVLIAPHCFFYSVCIGRCKLMFFTHSIKKKKGFTKGKQNSPPNTKPN